MFSLTFLIGCSKNNINLTGSEGLTDTVFKGIKPVYADGSSVGNLTDAYLNNTESLVIVNGRLDTLCKSHKIENCGPK